MPSPKSLALIPTLTLCCCIVANTAQVAPRTDDPCLGRGSNAEQGRCYAGEQARTNSEADDLVKKITTSNLRVAKDPEWRGTNARLIRQSATALKRSQEKWKEFRDQYCNAVQHSWTTGSGAGGAYQACMFELGKARVEQLRSDFPEATEPR